eukprot:COSAG05_NODE_2152_length_3472_cov_3.475245_2_plen_358_part_00
MGTLADAQQKVLLVCTDDGTVPCAAVAASLKSVGHKVVTAPPPPDPAAAVKLVKNIEQIVLLSPTADGEDGRTWLDMATRGTYDLLTAAAAPESTVCRCVVVSTMDLFLAYPLSYLPTEHWEPKPSTSPLQLGPHLAEFVLREFTRGSRLSGVVLRVGRPEDGSRFLLSSSAAAEGILELVQREEGNSHQLDAVVEHHHPKKYRVEHLIDPNCLTFANEAAAEAAAAADAAAEEFPRAGSAGGMEAGSKVLLLGANGMLGPPVVNVLGDSYALTVTDLHEYGYDSHCLLRPFANSLVLLLLFLHNCFETHCTMKDAVFMRYALLRTRRWRKEGDDVVPGQDRDDIDLVKPLEDFAQP